MLLRDLLKNVEYKEILNDNDIDINGIAYDSRKVNPGDLFFCIKGYNSDGHKYVNAAIEKGAVAIVCEDEVDSILPVIKVENSRKALSFISANFYDNPSKKLKVIGITGTNGKTSSTYLLKSILEACGYKVGLIGTNQNMIGERVLETERTTPESLELNELFAEMVEEKVNYVIMEVSSHSLYLDRVSEIEFKVGALSNVTQDHLDFHHTMEEYAKAKSILFEKSEISVLNIQDSYYELMKSKASGKVISYGVETECDICGYDVFLNRNGVSYNVKAGEEDARISVAIPAKFTVYNSLLALSIAYALEIPMPFIRMALKNQKGVKGRMEIVDTNTDYTVIIDYAHTPDGLESVLNSINEFKEKRVITVFGCGGDRDNKKRSIMGKIATTLSDFSVITSDNPRTEDPEKIIEEIASGAVGNEYTVIVNRKDAIKYALENANAGDIVLLAGKGHETYQILKEGKIHFDEREVISELLKK